MQRRIHFGEENHLFLDLNDPADFVEFGPSSDALRSTFLFQLALLGVLAFVLPLLLVLITGPQPAPSEILGNWWREIQAHQILISFAASIFAFSAYFSLRNYQRIWIENGRACFIRSRIWPRLKSETPLSEFSGVGFWFDGDGGHHHVRLPLSNEKDHVGAISTVELRHSDHDKCFPLLRLPAAQWLDEYQREFALELATPVVLPGTGEVFSPSPLTDLKQRLRDSTLFHAYSEGPVKVVSREDGETTVEYPFAPFDLLNVVSLSAAIPLVMPLMTAIVAHLYKSDFGNVLNFHPERIDLIFALTGIVVGAIASFVFAFVMKRRITFTSEEVIASVKPRGIRARMRVNDIQGFSEGRRVLFSSWKKGTWALWALSEDHAIPLAFGMDERTYRAVLSACDAVTRQLRKQN